MAKPWLFPLCLEAVLLLTSPSASAEEPSTDEDAQGHAQCARTEKLTPPPADLPDEKDKAALKDCDSTDLYYGIGRAADFVAARKCAYLELADEHNNVTGAAGVLTMLYANGQGVARNLDLAIHLACMPWGATADLEARTAHLQQIKDTPKGKKLAKCQEDKKASAAYCEGHFDVCDDILSDMMLVGCERLEGRIEEGKQTAELTKLISKWPAAHQKAYEELNAAALAYIEEYSTKEIDLGGTAGMLRLSGARNTELKKFRGALPLFESGKVPTATHDDFVTADKELNAAYKKCMKAEFNGGNVSKEGIQGTQRLWLKYRDAWLHFAALHYPQVPGDAFATWLTRDRTRLLGEVIDGDH